MAFQSSFVPDALQQRGGGLKGPQWEWVVWCGEPVWWGREGGRASPSVPA